MSKPGNGAIGFHIINDTGNNVGMGGVDIRDDSWHHIVAVRNDTWTYLYNNGTLFASTEVGSANLTVSSNLFIGQGGSNTKYLNGSIDFIAIYNTAFTADEVTQSYNKNYPLFGFDNNSYGDGTNLTMQIEPYDGFDYGMQLNSSSVTISTPTVDTTEPTWSNVQTNFTTIKNGEAGNFSVDWVDETALSSYIFSTTNCGFIISSL